MLKNLLKEVITLTAGKQAESIAELLYNKKHVNEFIIAKKLDLTINQTRNILYKISNFGLVSSIRKKDKKKGWYTYFWKFEILKCLEFLQDLLIKSKEELNFQIEDRKKNPFYICKRCNIEVGEEDALLMEFSCNECGDVFTVKDNSKFIKELEKNLIRINEKLKIVDVEMDKEKAIFEKLKQKEFKRIQAEKDAKRALAALKRKKEAKKRALKKKPAKKKVVKKKKSTKKKKTVKKKVVKKKKIARKKKPVKKKVVKKKKKIVKRKKPVKKKKIVKKKPKKKKIVKKKAVKKKK